MTPEISGHIALAAVGLVFLAFLLTLHEWRKSKKEVEKYKEKYERTLHHRKSAEVRLGKIGENLAPFVKGWPWNPKNFRFLGNPIDGVQFNDDGIIFIEIKTGGARLGRRQKDFRDLVKSGKVSFVTFKITENGTELVQEGEKS